MDNFENSFSFPTLDDNSFSIGGYYLFESSSITPMIADMIYDGCDFSPDHWNTFSEDQKMVELNELEGNIAEIQGRAPVEIQVKDFDILNGKTTYGQFDPLSGEIIINSMLLNSPELLPQVIDTIIHEGIHAYQHKCVTGEIEHYNPQEVAEWKDNFDNYKTASMYGMEIYLEQPLEIHARENAEKFMKPLYA